MRKLVIASVTFSVLALAGTPFINGVFTVFSGRKVSKMGSRRMEEGGSHGGISKNCVNSIG